MSHKIISWKRMWMLTTVSACALILAWALSGTGQSPVTAEGPERALLVTLVDAVPSTERVSVEALGVTRARWATSVAATVSGRVVFMQEGLAPGRLLQRGELLLKLQDERYLAQLAQARAQVAEAELQLARTLNEQHVVKGLNKATSAFGRREPHVKAAEAHLAASQAAQGNAAQQLADTEISSPFPAVLLEEYVSPGQWINDGEPLFRIASSESVDVEVELSAVQWRRLGTVGQQLSVAVTDVDGASWPAQIRYLSPVMDPTTRQRSLVLSVARPYNSQQPLLPDQHVRVRFDGVIVQDVVRAPASALTEDGNVWSVANGVLVEEAVELIDETTGEILFRFRQSPQDGRAMVRYPLSSMIAGQRVRRRS